MMLQNAVENAMKTPNFWPITLTISVLTAITLTWGLLGRISARFNAALDLKIKPLVEQLQRQGDTLGKEAIRLETHFDQSIREVEQRNKQEMTQALSALRQEIKATNERQQQLMLTVNTNTANIQQTKTDLQESKMDRAQLRRDSDAQQRQLDAIEKMQDDSREKILDAIDSARGVLGSAQGDLSTRLTRVEEAIKFYARIRTDDP